MQAQAISYGTWPILLTQPDSSRTAPAASIKEDNIRKIIICGGYEKPYKEETKHARHREGAKGHF